MPVALSIAALAWLISGEVDRAVAVLVAATPCPLILAVPIAIVAGLSQSAKNGAIIKGGGILELLSRTETVLIDKTGTLTHGGPVISEIATAPGISHNDLLQLAASIDQYSQHIVAKSIVECAKSKQITLSAGTDFAEVPGHQISGYVLGKKITVGQLVGPRPAWLTFKRPLIVAISADDQLIGIIGLEDPIRPESAAMIAALRKSGVANIALVTGDREETAQSKFHSAPVVKPFKQLELGCCFHSPLWQLAPWV